MNPGVGVYDQVKKAFQDGVDRRIDGLEHEVRIAMDIRERLAALEARRPA